MGCGGWPQPCGIRFLRKGFRYKGGNAGWVCECFVFSLQYTSYNHKQQNLKKFILFKFMISKVKIVLLNEFSILPLKWNTFLFSYIQILLIFIGHLHFSFFFSGLLISANHLFPLLYSGNWDFCHYFSLVKRWLPGQKLAELWALRSLGSMVTERSQEGI